MKHKWVHRKSIMGLHFNANSFMVSALFLSKYKCEMQLDITHIVMFRFHCRLIFLSCDNVSMIYICLNPMKFTTCFCVLHPIFNYPKQNISTARNLKSLSKHMCKGYEARVEKR